VIVAAAGVAAYARLADERESYARPMFIAGLRAAVQLGAVALLIGWVVRHQAALLGFVLLVVLLLLTGLLPLHGIALVPISGILIGGALTATVLGGRRALDELHVRPRH
jgi:putative ABC transport system permease protein